MRRRPSVGPRSRRSDKTARTLRWCNRRQCIRRSATLSQPAGHRHTLDSDDPHSEGSGKWNNGRYRNATARVGRRLRNYWKRKCCARSPHQGGTARRAVRATSRGTPRRGTGKGWWGVGAWDGIKGEEKGGCGLRVWGRRSQGREKRDLRDSTRKKCHPTRRPIRAGRRGGARVGLELQGIGVKCRGKAPNVIRWDLLAKRNTSRERRHDGGTGWDVKRATGERGCGKHEAGALRCSKRNQRRLPRWKKTSK